MEYSIARDKIPGKIEVVPEECAIIVNYTLQVKIFDQNYTTIAERSREKSIKINFTGMEPDSDLEEVADTLIDQTELLRADNRDDLIKALMELQYGCDGKYVAGPNQPDSPVKNTTKQITSIVKSGDVKSLAISMSKKEVDTAMHDSLVKIGMGSKEDVRKTLESLVKIASYDRNLALMVQNDPLITTLCTTLKNYTQKADLTICSPIMQIFERISLFRNFHDLFPRFKIGQLVLQVLFGMIKIADKVQESQKDIYPRYVKQQNVLLLHVINVLYNLTDNSNTTNKLVDNGIITGLVELMKRSNPELLTSVLRFIRKLSTIKLIWSNLDADEIINSIKEDIYNKIKPGGDKTNIAMAPVYNETLDLLFRFSEHPETLEIFRQTKLFDSMQGLCEIKACRLNLLSFFYQVSRMRSSDEIFKPQHVLNMLVQCATENGKERQIALVVLMKLTSSDKEVSEAISKSPVFTRENIRNIFIDCTKEGSGKESSTLLKLIRNVADNNPSLVEGFDDQIMLAAVKYKDQYDTLTDIMAVANRSAIDSSRSKVFMSNKNFMDLLINVLEKSTSRKVPPQLILEIVMLCGSLLLYSKPAKLLVSKNIVPLTLNVYNNFSDDYDMETQCLYCFYMFIIHGDSRKQLLEDKSIVDKVIAQSGSTNVVLADMASKVLDVLMIFDKSIPEKIRLPRFLAYNQDWLRQMGLTK